MKESVKITVIAAGFKEVAGKKTAQQKPSVSAEDVESEARHRRAAGTPQAPPSVVQQVARNVREVAPEVPTDDLDVPTFLRRQAQKA